MQAPHTLRHLFVAMSAPDPLPRTPLILRSALWRVGVALALSALLVALWHWALQGGGA